MFKCIMDLMKQKKARYTAEQISNGLDVLVLKVGRLALSVEIISPYFKDQRINGKSFVLPHPLVIILSDVIKYHYGQLYRCYFDTQGRENNTVSISVLCEQIFNDEVNGAERKKAWRNEFNEINSKLGKAQKLKKKLKQFSHKHFAHTDASKSVEESERELAMIGIPWSEFVNLINDVKVMLKNMCVACQKVSPDFSESQYPYLKNEFWESIKYREVNIVNHPPLAGDGK